jgi:quercetin dioxygenase-like cupin family protein
MARSDETIEHPVTGERITFLETSGDTAGERLRMDFRILAGGFVAAEHVHPYQEERLEVRSGVARFRLEGTGGMAREGEHVVVDPGTPHVWWNDGADELLATVEFRPALRTEFFFETFFAWAAEGKTNRKGLPSPLRFAVLAREYRDEVRLPIPYPVQWLIATPAAGLGRALGHRA